MKYAFKIIYKSDKKNNGNKYIYLKLKETRHEMLF